MYAVTITFRNCPHPPPFFEDPLVIRGIPPPSPPDRPLTWTDDGQPADLDQTIEANNQIGGGVDGNGVVASQMPASRSVMSKTNVHGRLPLSSNGTKIFFFGNQHDADNSVRRKKPACRCWLKSRLSKPSETPDPNKMNGPSRLLNDDIVARGIKDEPLWKQRRHREVTYHEQGRGGIPLRAGGKELYSVKKAQIHWMVDEGPTSAAAVASAVSPTSAITHASSLSSGQSTSDIYSDNRKQLPRLDSFYFARDRDRDRDRDLDKSLVDTQKTALRTEPADVGLNADIFRLPQNQLRSSGTVYHLGRVEASGPLVMVRGRRPKSAVRPADEWRLDASRPKSPAFSHRKAPIFVPPRTAKRLQEAMPMSKPGTADRATDTTSLEGSRRHLPNNRPKHHKRSMVASHDPDFNQNFRISIQQNLNKGDYAMTELALSRAVAPNIVLEQSPNR